MVAERAGTVTQILVEPGERVEAGDVLFTTDDTEEQAAVAVAEAQLGEIESAFSAAQTDVEAANASLDQANAVLKQVTESLADQEQLRSTNSPAFRANEYERLLNSKAANEAQVAAADASVEAARVQLDETLPARRASAEAAIQQARVELDLTTVRAGTTGTIEQLTLSVGSRAGQTSLGPAMLIVPEAPVMITAGFPQVARSILHVGMAGEVMCYSALNLSMTDVVLPVRVARIQNVIATGQVTAAGRLIEPSSVADNGDIVVHFTLEHPEQEALLPDGSSCIVQTYTTHFDGALEGTPVAHVIETLGVIKAVGLRLKAWTGLLAGVGLTGGGGH